MDDNQRLYSDAISFFGKEKQELKAIEEMAELIKALCKKTLGGDVKPVLEEIADVEIMLEQLKIIYPEYEAYKEQKIKYLKTLVWKKRAIRCHVCGALMGYVRVPKDDMTEDKRVCRTCGNCLLSKNPIKKALYCYGCGSLLSFVTEEERPKDKVLCASCADVVSQENFVKYHSAKY
jgi:hypothetical protein